MSKSRFQVSDPDTTPCRRIRRTRKRLEARIARWDKDPQMVTRRQMHPGAYHRPGSLRIRG